MTELAAKDYETMCQIGYGCGLTTIEGCYDQLSRHYDAFFLISEAVDRLKSLESYITGLGTWEKTVQEAMGQEWCDKQDAEEAAFWEGQKNG